MGSSIPMDGSPGTIELLMNFNPVVHNLLHIPVYSALAVLWMMYFNTLRISRIVVIVVSILITVLFGFADEVHQSYVPGRYGGLTDFCLNTIGACFGLMLFVLYEKNRVPQKI